MFSDKSDIYIFIFLVEAIIEVEDSLCVAQRKRDGSDERAILFIKMVAGQEFTAKLEKQIRDRIRSDLSVRHVPAHILPIDDIPVSIRASFIPEITDDFSAHCIYYFSNKNFKCLLVIYSLIRKTFQETKIIWL